MGFFGMWKEMMDANQVIGQAAHGLYDDMAKLSTKVGAVKNMDELQALRGQIGNTKALDEAIAAKAGSGNYTTEAEKLRMNIDTTLDHIGKNKSALEGSVKGGAWEGTKGIWEHGGFSGSYDALKKYYSAADAGAGERFKTGLVRGLTTYAGLSLGNRLITGGSLTSTSSGQRDIAGIPFI